MISILQLITIIIFSLVKLMLFVAFLAFLHLFGLLLVFYALCILCDEHLVPVIEIFITQFQVPEEVAAVTLIAFGSAAPELFLNSVGAMSNTSSLSLSAILGSGMIAFGFIPPICVLTSLKYEMKFKMYPILRECTFYLIGLGTFLTCIHDGSIGLFEACCILLVYVVYVSLVIFIYMRENKNGPKGTIKNNKNSNYNLLTILPAAMMMTTTAVDDDGDDAAIRSTTPEKIKKNLAGSSDRIAADQDDNDDDDYGQPEEDEEEEEDEETAAKQALLMTSEKRTSADTTEGQKKKKQQRQQDREEHRENQRQLMDMLLSPFASFTKTPTSANRTTSATITASDGNIDTDVEEDFLARSSKSNSNSSISTMRNRSYSATDQQVDISNREEGVGNNNISNSRTSSPNPPTLFQQLEEGDLEEDIEEATSSLGLTSTPYERCLEFFHTIISTPIREILKNLLPRLHDHPAAGGMINQHAHISQLVPLWRACLTLFMSIVTIALLASTIVAISESLVKQLHLGTATIGATLVAFGSEIPDAISSIALARNGYIDGALAGAIGSQVINISIGVGIPALFVCLAGEKGLLVINKAQTHSIWILACMLCMVIVSYMLMAIPFVKIYIERVIPDKTVISKSGATWQIIVWTILYMAFVYINES